jgi:hypothetical protein
MRARAQVSGARDGRHAGACRLNAEAAKVKQKPQKDFQLEWVPFRGFCVLLRLLRSNCSHTLVSIQGAMARAGAA